MVQLHLDLGDVRDENDMTNPANIKRVIEYIKRWPNANILLWGQIPTSNTSPMMKLPLKAWTEKQGRESSAGEMTPWDMYGILWTSFEAIHAAVKGQGG